MNEENKRQIYADVLERLIKHLQKRTDVQNIDLMNLSGFCRNCLSKWYLESASKRNIDVNYEEVRKIIYGMSYENWKKKYQKEVSEEQIKKFKANKD